MECRARKEHGALGEGGANEEVMCLQEWADGRCIDFETGGGGRLEIVT